MATKRSQPRSLYGTAEAHGHAQTQAVGRALAEAGQGHQTDRDEEAQSDVVDFVRTDAALKRLITEPGETWILETAEPPDVAMAALAAWSQTRQVVVLCFGAGEHFSLLSTQPGDTVILHTAHPENLNQQALAGWAQSRGLSLAVLPPEISAEHLDDATLDRMHLMRKPGGLIIPAFGQNGSPA